MNRSKNHRAVPKDPLLRGKDGEVSYEHSGDCAQCSRLIKEPKDHAFWCPARPRTMGERRQGDLF